MCIKINKVGKQEVGIWRVKKCFPRYGNGVPIWSLRPNIRFLPSIIAEKNVKKNIFGRMEGQTDGRKDDRGKTVYPLQWSGGIIIDSEFLCWLIYTHKKCITSNVNILNLYLKINSQKYLDKLKEKKKDFKHNIYWYKNVPDKMLCCYFVLTMSNQTKW